MSDPALLQRYVSDALICCPCLTLLLPVLSPVSGLPLCSRDIPIIFCSTPPTLDSLSASVGALSSSVGHLVSPWFGGTPPVSVHNAIITRGAGQEDDAAVEQQQQVIYELGRIKGVP